MEKHRYVSTSFWDDSYIMKLDPSEKLLFMYLLTNPLTAICGVYSIEQRRIAFDTGFDIEVVKTILKRFERDEKCIYRDGWIAMKNWIKHQNPSPKVVTGIQAQLKEVPEVLSRYVQGYGMHTASHLNSKSKFNDNGKPTLLTARLPKSSPASHEVRTSEDEEKVKGIAQTVPWRRRGKKL